MYSNRVGTMPDSVKYREILLATVQQLNNTNAMIQSVKAQADKAQADGDNDKFDSSERLVMHLDMKATTLLSIIASYEVAYQVALINDRANASPILRI